MKQPNSKEPLKKLNDLVRIKEKLLEKENRYSKQQTSRCYEIQSEVKSVGNPQHRKSIKKYLRVHSPASIVRSKSRPNVLGELQQQHIGTLYGELMEAKSEYKQLKGSYEKMADHRKAEEGHKMREASLQEAGLDVGRWQKTAKDLQIQLERIRKECIRVMETEKFKNKKLQEIIQEKDLMISFLRGEIYKRKRTESTWSTANQSAATFYPIDHINGDKAVLYQSHPKEEDSLCFSRDVSRDINGSSCLSSHNQPRKECVVIEPLDSPLKEPSQCLTFQQRGDEAVELKSLVRIPPRKAQKDGNVRKEARKGRKMQIVTQGDENKEENSGCSTLMERRLFSTYGSSLKHKKKTSGSRKKI